MDENCKCGTCLWFNGEVGDKMQFCDEKEMYVNENNCCIKYREKSFFDGLAKENDYDGD